MAMEWKDSYSCQIPEIDQQHKRLFEIGNQLYTLALLDGVENREMKVQKILSELHAYTIYHFEFEEGLLKQYSYPQTEAHHREHQRFIQVLSDMETKVLQGALKETVLELIVFVSEWISNHIVILDRHYTKHILAERSKEVSK